MSLADPTPRSYIIKNTFGHYVEHGLGEDVDNLTSQVVDFEGPGRENLARRLLAHNPESIEALLVLSEYGKTATEKLLYLQEAVRVGGHVWTPAIEEGDVAWWSEEGTQPYMRALATYGRVLLGQGHWGKVTACSCFEMLIEMNLADPLGVRADLAQALKPADEPLTDVELAERINAFVDAHAKKNPAFDPEEDWADAFLTGEDAKTFFNAAVALKDGREPDEVVSAFDEDSWNGCPNAELETEHDDLARLVNDRDYVRTMMPPPGCR